MPHFLSLQEITKKYKNVTAGAIRSQQTKHRSRRNIEGHLVDGFLPAAPREKACRFCDYQMVCGPSEELRVGRKSRQALVRLGRLRKMA